MRHSVISIFCFLGFFAAQLSGQSKPNLTGKWQVNPTKSEIHSTQPSAASLTIEQKGPSIHVVKTMKSGSKENVVEFNCTTDGKECTAGPNKISLWYDGKSLVEMDVAGENASKSTMTMDDGGKSLSIVVVYYSPQSEGDKLVLEKM
jgi:hypothetical protein